MSAPAPEALFAAMEATWPAARTIELDPFRLREGKGGGKRVSAATLHGRLGPDDIDAAAAAMQSLGQPPLFRLEQGGGAFDDALAAAGYDVADPTVVRVCPIGGLASERPPRVSAFTIWEPLQIMRDIWAEGGVGADRQAVMARVRGVKTGILGRTADKPAASAFVAIHDGIAMLHALEVRRALRRQGTAVNVMRQAAIWAAGHGATHMAVLVTEANAGANALYAALGMEVAARYHYRIKGDTR
ncbi:GNAT family N-acetyltransferase [Oceaniglobus roseus]|uniref:GNAT family N-acetyltransferase n=1 Tax=Oceaniglobus roseus TaxID=1737570 RepID=UPI000C7F6A8E|nr:GNAT family N-acetyltransferase [Kandeliimicrobium roseum]